MVRDAVEVTSSQETEATNSQETTITLTSPSQDYDSEFSGTQGKPESSVGCQTTDVIVMTTEEYDQLLRKASSTVDVEADLERLKTFFLTYDPQPPVMDPDHFQDICMQVGAAQLFTTLYNAMSSTRMSDERQQLTKLRVMVVLYIICRFGKYMTFSKIGYPTISKVRSHFREATI